MTGRPVECHGCADASDAGRAPSTSNDFVADVSLAGLGCDNFGDPMTEEASVAVVRRAVELGVTFFDTADCYGDGRSEEFLGRGLRGVDRDSYFLATKFGSEVGGDWSASGGANPAYVRLAVERSLRRLGVDHIDLYQLHEPDPSTPVEDTLAALDTLVTEGKIRSIGASNFNAQGIVHADDAAWRSGVTRFSTMQSMWNLLARDVEADLVPACRDRNIRMIPWFPLAGGLLTGKYTRGEEYPAGSRFDRMRDRLSFLADERAFDRLDLLGSAAREMGLSLLELALAWLAAQESVVSVIAGAMTVRQLEENVTATRLDIDQAVLHRVNSI